MVRLKAPIPWGFKIGKDMRRNQREKEKNRCCEAAADGETREDKQLPSNFTNQLCKGVDHL